VGEGVGVGSGGVGWGWVDGFEGVVQEGVCGGVSHPCQWLGCEHRETRERQGEEEGQARDGAMEGEASSKGSAGAFMS
jgi:hypothetical protein